MGIKGYMDEDDLDEVTHTYICNQKCKIEILIKMYAIYYKPVYYDNSLYQNGQEYMDEDDHDEVTYITRSLSLKF